MHADYYRILIYFYWKIREEIIIPQNVRIIQSVKMALTLPLHMLNLKNYTKIVWASVYHNGPEDTCGYTEMLEALSMGKPVLMTRQAVLI